jgi:hypothetical protein
MRRNKYGLARDIPDPIKRTVRQACRFGCVICGSSIVEYEHVDPEFKDAKEHDPQCITLLCPQCHSKVTTGIWSKEKVKAAMQDPWCKKEGYAYESFDIGETFPTIVFGGMTFVNCTIPIQVKDLPLIQIKRPEEVGAPFRLTAYFYNTLRALTLSIIDNEWYAYDTNWDVEVSGRTITVRDEPGQFSLRVVAEPPERLIIDRLDMIVHHTHFIGTEKTLILHALKGGYSVFEGSGATNCHIGFQID